MKKLSIFIIALLAAAFAGHASGTWTLQGAKYTVDTLAHYQIGPGTMLTSVKLTGAVTLKAWYTTTDLTNPKVAVKTVMGTNLRSSNLTLPGMVSARANDGNIYFAGVNADLFSTNGPIGTSVMNGEILKTAKTSTAWSAVGIENKDGDRSIWLGTAGIAFSAKLNGSMEYAPSLVNVPRATDECIIYTRRWGTTTGTTAGATGIEIAMRPADGILYSDRPTVCTVLSAPVKNGGNMAIPTGAIVVSSNVASHIRDLGLLKVGDTYTLTPATISISGCKYHAFSNITEMAGGDPMLLKNGQMLASYATMPNYDTRRARTAIGCDETHTKMMCLVVDGDSYNKGISAGVAAKDLAALMLAIGCWDALNFDGGGSSCIYTKTFGVLNRPSDGSNRAVRNGWFLTTPNNGNTEISTIAFVDPHKTMKIGETYTPKFYGYNNAGVLVSTNVTGVKLSCDARLGTVSSDGATLTVKGNGTYRLDATKGGFKCHIAVRAGDFHANDGENTGITDPTVADDAPAQYFTLDGLQASEPLAAGTYVQVKGGKSSKVVVK